MNNPLKITLLLVLLCLTLVLFLVDIVLGPVTIPIKDILRIAATGEATNPAWKTIIVDFRFPKAIVAVLSGMALSVSGLQMQTIFRNPLAGPYVLGISSGASLGVAIVMLGFPPLFAQGSNSFLSIWVQIMAAWIGSAAVLLLIMAISFRVRDIMTILILGVLFGSATSAIVSILQYFSHQTQLKAFVVWSMGNLGQVTKEQLIVMSVTIVAGLVLSLFSGKMLNVLLLGEPYAKSMGLNILLSRTLIFISTSVLAGSVTAFCGPIGFIGIAVPHITRLLFKSADHRLLIPAVILTGGIMMLVSDIISQLPGSESTLPVNSVTALIGIPVVVWVIFRNQKLTPVN